MIDYNKCRWFNWHFQIKIHWIFNTWSKRTTYLQFQIILDRSRKGAKNQPEWKANAQFNWEIQFDWGKSVTLLSHSWQFTGRSAAINARFGRFNGTRSRHPRATQICRRRSWKSTEESITHRRWKWIVDGATKEDGNKSSKWVWNNFFSVLNWIHERKWKFCVQTICKIVLDIVSFTIFLILTYF